VGEFFRELPEPVAVDALVARIPDSGAIAGTGGRRICGIAALAPGREGALSFCDAGAPAECVWASRSSVIVVASGADMRPAAEQTLIVVEDPRTWFIQAVETLLPAIGRSSDPAVGIHPQAAVHPDAQISASACIGNDVRIGAGTRIGPGAVIYPGSTVGTNCCIASGTVIGWVGLAYHEDRHGHRRFFPHLGGVRIGDWVDIGANCCVCRGILSDTTIGDQVKIGSLVYVGHGDVIEDKVWISAATAIAGHSRIGKNGLIGIGATVVDNVATEPGVLIGGGSVLTRNAQAGDNLVGVPARRVPKLRRFGPTPR